MKKILAAKITQALNKLEQVEAPLPLFVVEEPRDPDHGHLATNAAMVTAKIFRKKPSDIADFILQNLDNSEGYIEKIEKAGPGFINFTLSNKWWSEALATLLASGDNYGQGDPKGTRVMVEYVSANPTGPLHVGHGRGAAIGDALARLMSYAGYDVTTEYYINDAGRQMRTLGRSVFLRHQELIGATSAPFPEDHYQGQYIIDFAKSIYATQPEIFAQPEEETVAVLTTLAAGHILEGIKGDLSDFRVCHELWFSEQSLYDGGLVDKSFEFLEGQGHLYTHDKALWFKSESFGDDKDRVLVKSSGEKTYFAADIAYHWTKYDRGFDLLIDIWGADHHGYIPRMKAAVEALGRKREDLAVVLVQMVSLIKGGQPIAMSTRAGKFVTLKEVVDEVGADAARFMFLTRSPDTTLDFDLDLAKAKTKENPVYYIQYVGARIESILKAAPASSGPVKFELLNQPEEVAIIRHLTSFPELIQNSAAKREPHHLTSYLGNLARLFHHYYGQHHINVENKELAVARMSLIKAIRLVVRRGLGLLGVNSPDSM